MNQNILFVLIAFIALGGATLYFVTRAPEALVTTEKALIVEQNIAPVELLPVEQQASQDESSESLKEIDIAENLPDVQSFDNLNVFEADLEGVDIIGLNAELEAILDELSSL